MPRSQSMATRAEWNRRSHPGVLECSGLGRRGVRRNLEPADDRPVASAALQREDLDHLVVVRSEQSEVAVVVTDRRITESEIIEFPPEILELGSVEVPSHPGSVIDLEVRPDVGSKHAVRQDDGPRGPELDGPVARVPADPPPEIVPDQHRGIDHRVRRNHPLGRGRWRTARRRHEERKARGDQTGEKRRSRSRTGKRHARKVAGPFEARRDPRRGTLLGSCERASTG